MSEQPKEKPYQYVNQHYGLEIKPGQRVIFLGHRPTETGVVVRKRSYDHYVHVRFDGQRFDVACHPLDLKPEATHAD